MTSQFMLERDLIAAMGILARAYVDFDPPVVRGDKQTHVTGFNVHCFVLDNRDGEVIAVGRNRIFAESDPLQHAEQVGIRQALSRLKEKRPRPSGMPVTDYYKGHLFMEPGTSEADFSTKGCTLYNTFDPCGFCATTLLVCYMKRIAYLFEDAKFSEVYGMMKREYFKGRDSVKQPIEVVENGEGFIATSSRLLSTLRSKVHQLEQNGTDLVLTLDVCREDLSQASVLLSQLTENSLQTSGNERVMNVKTLRDVQRIALGV